MTTTDPSLLVDATVDQVLALASTWMAWDGRPRLTEDRDRVYTPHKAIRRTTDHLIDHLAEIEALVAGAESIPDSWHGSLVTVAADLTPFTEADLNEARQRLPRLAQIYKLRLESLGIEEWDKPRPGHMTIREIVDHVASPWYAEQVGDLATADNG